MFKGKDKFISDRLYLRTLDANDANEVYCSWLNDPEVNKFLATKHATTQELVDYIKEKNNHDDILLLGIFMKESNKFIGTIKLGPVDSILKKSNIAVMLGDKSSWGKGFGLEALNILIGHCFIRLKLEEVYLGVIKQNLAALSLYKKAGFGEVVGRFDMLVNYDGEEFNQITMSLTRECWLDKIKK